MNLNRWQKAKTDCVVCLQGSRINELGEKRKKFNQVRVYCPKLNNTQEYNIFTKVKNNYKNEKQKQSRNLIIIQVVT